MNPAAVCTRIRSWRRFRRYRSISSAPRSVVCAAEKLPSDAGWLACCVMSLGNGYGRHSSPGRNPPLQRSPTTRPAGRFRERCRLSPVMVPGEALPVGVPSQLSVSTLTPNSPEVAGGRGVRSAVPDGEIVPPAGESCYAALSLLRRRSRHHEESQNTVITIMATAGSLGSW